MKKFKDVEATRRAYHADAALNSVHRSSLLVPELPGADVEISFLNHFLIKRGYENVACRITAIDGEGERIESRLHRVDEPRVYTIPLSGTFPGQVVTFLVEFFAAENLFIPFPAVMVNHRGKDFLNTVHAFNRVLNDVFEDDAINREQHAEASIDVKLSDATDTIAYLMAGQARCQGIVSLELSANEDTLTAEIIADIPRFGHQALALGEIFPGVMTQGGVLKIRQPHQDLFFGRMLVIARNADGAFSGNHSYYDSSSAPEYWDDSQPSERLYPFFTQFENIVRMYPIMSEGTLTVTTELFAKDGKSLGVVDEGSLASPGTEFFELSLDQAAAAAAIDRDRIGVFALRAAPKSGNTPVRINHQLVYGDKSGQSPLTASVNVSLVNSNVFMPDGKTGLAWGQVPVGGGLSSSLGVVRNFTGGKASPIQIKFWSESGAVTTQNCDLPPSGAVHVDLAEVLGSDVDSTADAQNIWYEIRSDRPDLSAFVATRHEKSGHTTGEHSY